MKTKKNKTAQARIKRKNQNSRKQAKNANKKKAFSFRMSKLKGEITVKDTVQTPRQFAKSIQSQIQQD